MWHWTWTWLPQGAKWDEDNVSYFIELSWWLKWDNTITWTWGSNIFTPFASPDLAANVSLVPIQHSLGFHICPLSQSLSTLVPVCMSLFACSLFLRVSIPVSLCATVSVFVSLCVRPLIFWVCLPVSSLCLFLPFFRRVCVSVCVCERERGRRRQSLCVHVSLYLTLSVQVSMSVWVCVTLHPCVSVCVSLHFSVFVSQCGSLSVSAYVTLCFYLSLFHSASFSILLIFSPQPLPWLSVLFSVSLSLSLSLSSLALCFSCFLSL